MCNFEISEGIYCPIRGTYGFEGSSERFCVKHNGPLMIQLEKQYRQRCKCGKIVSYGFEGKKPTCCAQCCEPGMLNTRAKRCKKCNKVACFGLKGGKIEYCKEHSSQEMNNLTSHKKCYCGKKRPSFNLPGLKPEYCKECMKPEMQDVTSKKRCVKCKGKFPSFNLLGLKPEYCKICATNSMVDVHHKKCEKCNLKIPVFNYKGLKPQYCNDCKNDQMLNLVSPRCEKCDTLACFNFKGKTKPRFCATHSKKNMVNVISKMCIKCGKVSPLYNFPNLKPEYCKKCSKPGMKDVGSKKCVCGKVIPCFGFEGKFPKFCKECRPEETINLRPASLCKANERGILCPVTANKKYDGYCANCFVHLFPTDPRTLKVRQKSKELQVVSFVNENYKDFAHDRPIYLDYKGGCCETKRRIDLRTLIGNTMLCIEVDENQHKYYDAADEEERYDNLFMDFSGKYIFIRYNPDKYKDADGKTKNPQAKTRLRRLEEEIDRQIERIENGENTELVEVAHLYFDEAEGAAEEISKLKIN